MPQMTLPVKLSDEEKARMGEDLSANIIILKQVREKAAEAAKASREEIKDLEVVVAELARALDSGEAERPVEVQLVLDEVTKEIVTVRMDTPDPEEVRRRPASPDELQGELPLTDAENVESDPL